MLKTYYEEKKLTLCKLERWASKFLKGNKKLLFKSLKKWKRSPLIFLKKRNCPKLSEVFRFYTTSPAKGLEKTHRPNICSWNIRETFPWVLLVYSEKIPNEILGNIPEYYSGNIEYRNIPWLFQKYSTNVTRFSLVDQEIQQ